LTTHLASLTQAADVDISSAEFLDTVRVVTNDYGRLYVEQTVEFSSSYLSGKREAISRFLLTAKP